MHPLSRLRAPPPSLRQSHDTFQLGLSDSEYELEGIMAKLSGNNDKRTLAVNVRREWNKDKGWEYTVAAR